MKKNKKKNNFINLLNKITIVTSVIAVGISASFLIDSFFNKSDDPYLKRTIDYKSSIDAMKKRNSELDSLLIIQLSELSLSKSQIDTLINNYNPKEITENQSILSHLSNLKIGYGRLNSEVKILNDRLSKIENAILDNPTKALSIPLMQKDLTNFNKTYKSDLEVTRAEISRVYDQNKWFIGLMFTLAIGILGLAASNFTQSRKTNDNNNT
ncbi:hypothetical protein [Winogradskyella sp.]|uniref:hypothetical protein n=1 Tax=Winogradskyella sp. TaxID=1883156 RepID=UPI0025CE3A01|nr:hypothetical protein [Winogradskyella sp.]